MYKGRYEGAQPRAHAAPARRKAPRSGRLLTMALAAMLLLALAIGGTVAWLSTKSDGVTNTFLSSKVSCKVTEKFDSSTGVKSEVNVKNTGDIDAFVRVKLVTYRTSANGDGTHIGGLAGLPAFTPGDGWVLYNGYYYYTKPVAPGASPAADLIESIQLISHYDDADGGSQAVDVMAEAIQSVPQAAVQAAWGSGFSIGEDGSLNVPAN